ncbi:hypothetical protein MPPM_5130 [Methylorubrum populi]|uniref:Caspase family protein n=1 Tax=Methylorubrum populi TaxID=223967 RepID=A0A160PKX8_9HYPH|nr:hypothetical protein [Methylorubrum populi]BAU93735.1 hypothetical protein MPPM_5130 [Methylorubrum populi]
MIAPNNRGNFSLIIIGSDIFEFLPPSFSKQAFKNSAGAFYEYMTTFPSGPRIESSQVLNLFASPLKIDEQDERITDFIRNMPSECNSIIIYYVGHGDFLSDRQYYLSVKKTDRNRRHFTGLKVRDLAETLKLNAPGKRIYLILDCCFAGAAVSEFMSQDLSIHIENQTFSNFPELGTALLVAASRNEPALTPDGNAFTMLSENLIEVLKTGSASKGAYLSIRDIGDLVARKIRAKYGSSAVIPEIHAPKQINSDISDRPLFINSSFDPYKPKENGYDYHIFYDSNKESVEFQSWITIKPNVPGLPEVAEIDRSEGYRVFAISSKGNGKVGVNKYIPFLKGRVDFEYKISSHHNENIVFSLLPLHLKTKDEFDNAWEGIRGYSMLYDDFKNSRQITANLIKRSRHIIKNKPDPNAEISHIMLMHRPILTDTSNWITCSIDFDFEEINEADYCVFCIRMNEWTDTKGPGRLLFRRVKIFEYRRNL